MMIIMMTLGCIFMINLLSKEMLAYLLSLLFFIMMFQMGNLGLKINMIYYDVGWDIISFSSIMLSLLISFLMLLGETKVNLGKGNFVMFKLLVLSILFSLLMSFSVMNMLMFYLAFEVVLIPMLLLIYVYGYQPERLESGMYMLMYTMFGSLPLLMGILMFLGEGSLNIMYMLNMKNLYFVEWSMLLLVGFLVKLPLYGFHIWLPKAHVEAPVSGSMILAGILLKLGCYGFYRFFPFLKMGLILENLLMVMGLWGGILSGFMCLRQLDIKKLVAYSSVVHSGLFFSGIIMYSGIGMFGGLIMMIGHGLCSSGLFYMMNLVYVRLMTRSLLIVKGVMSVIPSLMLWFFLLSVANSATPPFLNLFGEIFLGSSVLMYNMVLSLLLFVIYFISVGYGIYFYSVLSHGDFIKSKVMNINVNEFFMLFIHFCPVMLLVFMLKNAF